MDDDEVTPTCVICGDPLIDDDDDVCEYCDIEMMMICDFGFQEIDMNIRFEIMCNLDGDIPEMDALKIEEHLYYLMENILGVDCGISVIKADEDVEIL